MRGSERIPGRRFLHSPGPTHVPDEVLDAMHRQPMDLADPRFAAVVDRCNLGLQRIAGGAGAEIFVYAANGHGAWEAAIANLLAPGAQVLIPGTGHFSDAWTQQTQGLGHEVIRTPWREGYPIDPNAIEQALRADALDRIAAVFVVHTDTAAGVTSDIDAVRAAIDAAGHPALLVVDAVATLGALPLAMDRQRIDVLIAASQKGLMLPPGLGIVAAGPRSLELAQRNPAPRWYWDWQRRIAQHSYQRFCGTAPMNLLFALDAAIGLLEAEGLDAVFERHRLLAGAVQAAVEGWSEGGALRFFCKAPAARSVSVTTVETAPGVDADAIRTAARERFQVAIAGGLGPLTGRAFRIGHLGDLSVPMVLGAIAGVEAALVSLGVPVGGGGTRRAIEFVAASH
jgi:alanine-glyoxylate transaminase/serine-glyoxylate transaminase/serine-pyruvate transaminase